MQIQTDQREDFSYGRMTMKYGRVTGRIVETGVAVVLGGALLVFAASAASAAPAEVWKEVKHNTTFVQFFDGEHPCGWGPVTETMENRLELQRLTQRADGSFNFVDFETGLIYEDYVDPAIEDLVYRRTSTFTINLTPGEVLTRSETFRQSNGELTFLYRYHLTEVQGEPVVEKEMTFFPSCP